MTFLRVKVMKLSMVFLSKPRKSYGMMRMQLSLMLVNMERLNFMKASDLERKLDENEEDILEHFDLSTATRINHNKNKKTDHLPER